MADKPLELYYFPASFYSQRAFLALCLKKVTFNKKVVFIHFNEQNQEWFLKINPKGVVPAIRHGDTLVNESEVIVDYIDKTFGSGPSLVPDISTNVGKQVDIWRKKLDTIRIDQLTYGLLANPELSVSGIKLPRWMMPKRSALISRLTQSVDDMFNKSQTENNQVLRDNYLVKSEALEERLGFIKDSSAVARLLDNLESTFDDVEEQLQRTILEQGNEDAWLVCSSLTAADINLIIVFDRLDLVGLLKRYLVSKRPQLCNYYKRLEDVDGVKCLRSEVKGAMRLVFFKKVKEFVPHGLSILALAAAVAIGTRYLMNNK